MVFNTGKVWLCFKMRPKARQYTQIVFLRNTDDSVVTMNMCMSSAYAVCKFLYFRSQNANTLKV